MNQEQNNFNTQGSNGVPNNQTINIQQSIESKKIKKKKYWLIPLLFFITMVLSKVIDFVIKIMGVESSIISSISSILFFLCGFAVVPSIIIAIVFSNQNK